MQNGPAQVETAIEKNKTIRLVQELTVVAWQLLQYFGVSDVAAEIGVRLANYR